MATSCLSSLEEKQEASEKYKNKDFFLTKSFLFHISQVEKIKEGVRLNKIITIIIFIIGILRLFMFNVPDFIIGLISILMARKMYHSISNQGLL